MSAKYIFRYLVEKNGLEIGKDVMVDYTYGSPDELATAITTGLVSLAVLPEPKVTAIKSQNAAVRSALDFTAEWNRVSDGELVQGCIVVQKSFAEEHPVEVAKFLEEYEASIAYLTEDTASAAQMIVDAGIFAQAPVAQKAIPNCNLCFIAGADMQTALGQFLEIMAGVAAPSVGGAVPAADFYYIG